MGIFMSQRQFVIALLSLIVCLAAQVALPAGCLFAETDPSDEKPTIEIKILNQTDKYFDIDIGIGMPVRIRREDIHYMAEHLPVGIGRLFSVKTGSGVPINILLDDQALEKLKTAQLNTSEEGFVVESLIFGKIVFRDLTPPPENIHKLPEMQLRLNQELIAAAKEGRTFDVSALLSQGADPNARRGMAYNQAPSKRMMLDLVNRGVNEGNPASADEVNELFNQQAFADTETPLLYAAQGNYIDIATLLLERGADPTTDTYAGDALGEAARYRHVEMVRLLLKRGAKLTSVSALTAVPFLSDAEATAAQERDLEIVDLLISHGADVNHKDRYDTTVLHAFCNAGSLIHGPEIIDRLIKAGADVNQPGWQGPPLVACMGDDRIVERLLAAGADVHAAKVRDGDTLLESIVSYLERLSWGHVLRNDRYIKSIRLVLEAGAKEDATPEQLAKIEELLRKLDPPWPAAAAAMPSDVLDMPREAEVADIPPVPVGEPVRPGEAIQGVQLFAKSVTDGQGIRLRVSLVNVDNQPLIVDMHGHWLFSGQDVESEDLLSQGPLKQDHFIRLDPGKQHTVTLQLDGFAIRGAFSIGYQPRAASPKAAAWLQETFGSDVDLVWRGTVYSAPLEAAAAAVQ